MFSVSVWICLFHILISGYVTDLHPGSRLCKILRIILKMDKGGTQRNESKGKKVDDYAQGFTCERWNVPRVCMKKLCLSLLMSKNLKLIKVNKKFRNWTNFVFFGFLYAYEHLWTFSVSVWIWLFHVSVSWLRYISNTNNSVLAYADVKNSNE